MDSNRIIKYSRNRSVGGIVKEIGSPHSTITVVHVYRDLFLKKPQLLGKGRPQEQQADGQGKKWLFS